jgi:hypothetical protein
MKKFLSKIALLVTFVIATMVTADALYTAIFTAAPPRTKTKYIIGLKDERIDYIFLGSSRVRNSIVTKIVEDETSKKALNLGIDGAKPDDVFLQLKLLVHNNIQFEKIFIQVDYTYNDIGPSAIVGSEALPFIRSNEVIGEQMCAHPKFNAYYYVPFYRYQDNDYAIGFRTALLHIVDRKKINFADGFDPREDTFTDIAKPLPDTIVKLNPTFNKIQAFCQRHNIDVVYYTAPYCDNFSDSRFSDLLKQKIPQLRDYSKALTEKKYFRDCRHLKTAGAEIFTRMLIADCITNNHLNKSN